MSMLHKILRALNEAANSIYLRIEGELIWKYIFLSEYSGSNTINVNFNTEDNFNFYKDTVINALAFMLNNEYCQYSINEDTDYSGTIPSIRIDIRNLDRDGMLYIYLMYEPHVRADGEYLRYYKNLARPSNTDVYISVINSNVFVGNSIVTYMPLLAEISMHNYIDWQKVKEGVKELPQVNSETLAYEYLHYWEGSDIANKFTGYSSRVLQDFMLI